MTTLHDMASVGSRAGNPAPFTPESAPDHPRDLFADWFGAAITAGLTEPHTMTLSTVDADGPPDAQVLIRTEGTEHGSGFVEFWQGQTDRNHLRLQYVRSGSGWGRHRLQP